MKNPSVSGPARAFAGAFWALAAFSAAAQVDTSVGAAHFADGDRIGTGTFLSAVSGQPVPFNQFHGADLNGPNFQVDWMMTFTPPATVGATALTLGIFDHDSQATGNQVASFTVAGQDLTALLNSALESRGGHQGEYNLYTITLPSSTYAALETGSIAFELQLAGPGLGVLGETSFNGAGLDFAGLSIAAVPEPASTAFVFGGACCLAGIWLKRRRG